MPSAVEEIISQIESNAPEITIDEVKQKLSSLGKDEWCTVLSKIRVNLKHLAESSASDKESFENLRLIATILGALEVCEVNFWERDELAEAVGLIIGSCSNAKLQKSFSDILLEWVKSEWLSTGPCLYGYLKHVVRQVKSHKKAGDIKNLAILSGVAAYAVRCSNDAVLITELCSIGVHPSVFQSQDGRKFTVKLFEQIPQRMHEQMKVMLSGQDKKLGKALGDLYHRCVTTFTGQTKETFLQQCLQDLAYWSLCMPDENLALTLIEAMVNINKKMKISKNGSDDLFDIYAPFLMKMTEVPNSVFRNRAARLLITAFPLVSSKQPADDNEDLQNNQLAAIERLLEDNVPAVRATAVVGLCELSSCIAEALPVGWLQKVLGKVFVRLAFDVSSPDVRLACVKGLGRLVENHVLWPLAERLFSEIKHLLHDKSHVVRAAFAQLLDKIAKLHAFKPWKYLQSRADFLPRLAMDDPTICRPLASLLLEYYLPSDKDAVSHLDTCINLVEFNALAARNFYRIAMAQLTFVRSAAFIDIVLRHLAIKSARLLKKMEIDGDDANVTLQTTAAGVGDMTIMENGVTLVSAVESLVKLTDVAAACWLALLPQLKQTHNSATARDLERLAATALPRIFKLCEHFHRDASNVVLFASCLPWRTVPVIFQKTVGFLKKSEVEESESSSANGFRQTASVAIKALTNWAKLSELLHIIHESIREGIAALRKKSSAEGAFEESKRRSTRKRVRFDKKGPAKESAESANAGVDLETHLGLLDILLRNRSCVRQLRGKEPQMREIWDELTAALDLIGNTALNWESDELGEVDRRLLLCFEFYCRIGLWLHVDTTKTPAVIDDSFLKQLTKWLRSHMGISSVSSAKPLNEFQVGLCRHYLKQLTTCMMLNAVTNPSDKDASIASGMGLSDIFEMSLDATAYIPAANRATLAETVISLVHASVVKLTTLNGQLSIQERSEHMRILLAHLVALDDSNKDVSASTLVHATDCFVLLALLCKKAEKTHGRNASDEDRIAEGFSRLVSIVVKTMTKDETSAENEDDESSPKEKRRPISKNPQDSSYLFNVVFSRFYPNAVRGIFCPYLPILGQKLPENAKFHRSISKWLINIGYDVKELPAAFVRALEEDKSSEVPAEVNENSVECE